MILKYTLSTALAHVSSWPRFCVGGGEQVLCGKCGRQAGRQAGVQACRQAGRQAGRLAGRQAGRQAGKHGWSGF